MAWNLHAIEQMRLPIASMAWGARNLIPTQSPTVLVRTPSLGAHT